MCTRLCHQAQSRPVDSYFDAPDNLRHRISPICDPGDCVVDGQMGDPVSLSQILREPAYAALNVPQQIRLAANLVKGVLQFHSTPWLRDLWRLEELCFFNTEACLAESLRTLHITSELLPQQRPSSGGDAAMREASAQLLTPQPSLLSEDNNSSNSDNELVETAKLHHGIRNLSLHSLGTALLQIGHWDPTLDPGDLVHIRRLGGSASTSFPPLSSPLGPRYQRAVQRCLECDFGLGADLSQPELAAAVYWDVARELEDIARGLEDDREVGAMSSRDRKGKGVDRGGGVKRKAVS